MKGVYTVSIPIAALAAAKTALYITAPATKVIEILSASLTNESNETNEQVECCLQRVNVLGAPTKTDVTPAKHENGDQAATATCAGNVTASEPSYVADTEIGREGFPSLGGWRFDPVPEERMYIPPSGTVGLRVLNSPTAFDAIAKLTFREIG